MASAPSSVFNGTPHAEPGHSERTHVTAIQRARVIAALVEMTDEDGYAHATIGAVIGRARVSRKTFYDHFSNREDCFLAAFEEADARARDLMSAAYLEESDWRRGTRAALQALLQAMDEEPGYARLCIVEALAAGERVLHRRAEVLSDLTRAIDAGRLPPRTSGAGLTPLTAEALVGAIISILHTRLLARVQDPLVSLLDELMSIIVLPYLGPRAAQHELRQRASQSRRPAQRGARAEKPDPLENLNFRLTYRTVRVLMAVGEYPGASNRQVAESSGIIDQGQISKLLARLAGLGLVENRGLGQPKGANNEWHLTPRGAGVERVARPR